MSSFWKWINQLGNMLYKQSRCVLSLILLQHLEASTPLLVSIVLLVCGWSIKFVLLWSGCFSFLFLAQLVLPHSTLQCLLWSNKATAHTWRPPSQPRRPWSASSWSVYPGISASRADRSERWSPEQTWPPCSAPRWPSPGWTSRQRPTRNESWIRSFSH